MTMCLKYLELLNAYEAFPLNDDYVVFGTEAESRPSLIQVYHEEQNMSKKPVAIKAICVSESESHVATLSLVRGEALIQVWSLQRADIQDKATYTCIANKHVTLPKADLTQYPNISLALSGDGMDVVVCQAPSDEEPVQLDGHSFPLTGLSPSLTLTWVKMILSQFWSKEPPEVKITTRLGYGKFTNPYPEGEMFLHVDGNSVLIYKTWPEWSLVYFIPLKDPSPPSWGVLKTCIESANGPFFAWSWDPIAVSIWSVEFGSIVSFISTTDLSLDDISNLSTTDGTQIGHWLSPGKIIRFAGHGRALAIASGHFIRKYVLPSATEVGMVDTRILGSNITVVDLIWPETGPELMVLFRENRSCREYLVNVNVESSSWAQERYICPGPFATSHIMRAHAYTVHGSTIDVCDIEVLQKEGTFSPSSTCACTKDCERQFKDLTATRSECSMDNGLEFRIEMSKDRDVAEVVVINLSGVRTTCLQFPIRNTSPQNDQDTNGTAGLPRYAFFLDCQTRFAVLDADFVMIWRLPSDQDGCCDLITMRKMDRDSLARVGFCTHSRWLEMDFGESQDTYLIDLKPLENNHYIHVPHCQTSLPDLVRLYTTPDTASANWNSWRQGLVRYVGRQLASCTTKEISSNVLLKELCQTWELKDLRQGLEQFLKDLMLGPDLTVRWLPVETSHSAENPIYYTLMLFHDNRHQNPTLHNTLIEHCIRNARRLSDTFYLGPVLNCIQLMGHIDKGLVLDVLHRIAFIPVKAQDGPRPFILNHAANRGGSLNIGSYFRRLLHLRSKDAGMSSSLHKVPNSMLKLYRPQGQYTQTKHRTEKVFVAPMAILWTMEQDNVQGHKFSLEAYDNPALDAVLEYKWGAGGWGFGIWTLFLRSSVTIYILYCSIHGITVVDGVPTFMALNVFGKVGKYIGTAFFGVQCLVFIIYELLAFYVKSLPINNNVPGVLILFVFPALGIVVIWTQSIQALAMLLLLVYIIVAGRYDPVSDEMDGGDYTFLFVMTLYYLFSAIVMLNVLIGLVGVSLNEAIKTDDRGWLLTWRQNRYYSSLLHAFFGTKMTLVTKSIKRRWQFEREVYYTATEKDINEFYRRNSPEGATDMLNQDLADAKATPTSLTLAACEGGVQDGGQKSAEEMRFNKLQTDFDSMKSMMQKEYSDMKSTLAQILDEKRKTTPGSQPPLTGGFHGAS
ncbi:hypothetical protein BGZ58_010526 [Dissophora ornata]|nr:hypothetical protein BGZ58_010526 [Dissophora ornata]